MDYVDYDWTKPLDRALANLEMALAAGPEGDHGVTLLYVRSARRDVLLAARPQQDREEER